jgi:anti-sigma regulatory factor (Ser/Thr protein kinase)
LRCAAGEAAEMDRIETSIANRLEEMPEVVAMVERFGLENNVPLATINELNVALDEVLNNIISYGFEDGEQSRIQVALTYRPGEITAQVEDSGKPFDPLQVPTPDLTVPLKDRQIGGLGIHFVRNLMDEVIYARVDGKNRLRLRKKIA